MPSQTNGDQQTTTSVMQEQLSDNPESHYFKNGSRSSLELARFVRLEPFAAKGLFERSLETMRLLYNFVVSGCVIMPEHVHLLVGEPGKALLSTAIPALKLSAVVQSQERPLTVRVL